MKQKSARAKSKLRTHQSEQKSTYSYAWPVPKERQPGEPKARTTPKKLRGS